MPKLTVEGVGEFDVPQGKRLVLALEDEAKIDQLHACGGNARCTTCRVEFVSGEPEMMTQAEKAVLAARGLTGVRLSCQILCDHDMTVRAISRLAGSGRADAGSRPAADIQPQPVPAPADTLPGRRLFWGDQGSAQLPAGSTHWTGWGWMASAGRLPASLRPLPARRLMARTVMSWSHRI